MAKPRAEGRRLDTSSSWTEVNDAQRSCRLRTLEDMGIRPTWWPS